ncbi:MAG: protein phosphatase 2C domain-containing protein [bacterium]|nr:protein phosphatase 2C domain-containing protein [bacterium]
MNTRYDDPAAQPDTCDHGNTPGYCTQCRDERLGRPNPLLDPERTIIEPRPRGAFADALPELIEAEPTMIAIGAATEQNETKGDKNEDSVLVDHRTNTYGVLDGMGGHAAGEVASAKATQFIVEQMIRMPKGIRHDAAQVAEYLRSAFAQAHGNLMLMAEADPKKLKGMGATASVMHLVEAKDGGVPREAVIASVGDSRVYLLRGGALKPLTKDQSLIQGLMDQGALPKDADQIGDPSVDARLSEDQRALVKNRRNIITGGLGVEGTLRVDTTRVPLEAGDVLFATSDGVHDNLTDREIATIAQRYASDPMRLSTELIRAARERSRDKGHIRHKDDDISAVAVHVSE